MGDYNFIKYYVCLHNKWNPYSDDIKKIPTHYWMAAYGMISQGIVMNWKEQLEPQAELIGQLCKPEVYKQYITMKKQMEDKKKKGAPLEASYQDGNTKVTHAVADTHYDPTKGLVSEKGDVLIPKDKYDKMLKLDGVAVSY